MEKIIYCDTELCVGCGACVVACMDENDVNLDSGEKPNRRCYRFEDFLNPQTEIVYISTACMHCQDSPCILGCPTGAICRDEKTNAVVVERDLCIGCHSCALACPTGVPRYDLEDKLVKCDLCSDRLVAGLEPACVRVCPFNALQMVALNSFADEKEKRHLSRILGM